MQVLGQGAWYMGEKSSRRLEEIEALRQGVRSGMALIDTAEMYGEGLTETLVGEAVKEFNREDLFLVSKVYPHHAGRKNIFDSLRKSLERLDTPYLNLYLLLPDFSFLSYLPGCWHSIRINLMNKCTFKNITASGNSLAIIISSGFRHLPAHDIGSQAVIQKPLNLTTA